MGNANPSPRDLRRINISNELQQIIWFCMQLQEIILDGETLYTEHAGALTALSQDTARKIVLHVEETRNGC